MDRISTKDWIEEHRRGITEFANTLDIEKYSCFDDLPENLKNQAISIVIDDYENDKDKLNDFNKKGLKNRVKDVVNFTIDFNRISKKHHQHEEPEFSENECLEIITRPGTDCTVNFKEKEILINNSLQFDENDIFYYDFDDSICYLEYSYGYKVYLLQIDKECCRDLYNLDTEQYSEMIQEKFNRTVIIDG